MTSYFRSVVPALFAIVLLAFGLAATNAMAQDGSRYAALVMDAESGETLFSRHSDERRYPASLTKIMTLYMAFEAIEEGRVRPSDVLTISSHAASQPPSKLGLYAGQTITLDDAMKATAVRSANDMAVAIAEHISGSESAFTAAMTRKAQEIGMTSSRYVNANGLPDSRQVTTVRDLATLSRAVMRDYPQHYHYFSLNNWVYNGRTYRNTNGLLASIPGYDGMKTGYINASGYNLSASAVRNGRRLITIVLGGRSTATRNAHVAELMDTGFDLVRRRGEGEQIQMAQSFFEARGYGIPTPPSEPETYASVAAPSSASENTATFVSGPVVAQPVHVAPSPSERTLENVLAQRQRAAAETQTRGQQARVTNASTTNRRAAAPRQPQGQWTVQVGAFRNETVARDWLTEINRRFRSSFTGAERNVQNAGEWYRSRFTGLTEDAAKSACEALAARRVTCVVIRP